MTTNPPPPPPPPHHRRRLLPSSSWAEIPEELLRLIFERISDWSDLHQCLGVCPLWFSTARPVLSSRTIGTPFLLLINPKQKQEPCKLLDLGGRTFCLKARMELANYYTIYNSNRGWLLMHSNNNRQEYSLYNPITREIVQLPSPPNGPFRKLIYVSPPPAEAELKVFRIHKFVMSTSPQDPDCVVCILSQHLNNLAFCKPASSNKSFKLITGASANIYSDMIFYKGELYAVNAFSQLYVMKLSERDNQIVVKEHQVVRTEIRSSRKARELYLAEEPISKQLLLVEKVQQLYWDSAQRKGYKMISKTLSFRFFKLKYYSNSAAATPTAVWVELVRRFDSDHHALLLVSGGSMFVSTDHLDDDRACYKPNCIYFVDEFYNSDPLNYLKVYDLKNHTVEPFNFNPSCYNNNSQRLASDGLCTWFRASTI